jgi:hypothetical protein
VNIKSSDQFLAAIVTQKFSKVVEKAVRNSCIQVNFSHLATILGVVNLRFGSFPQAQ